MQPAGGTRPGRPLWTTGPWFFRDERMYLIPGDSPMGYRLPLDSLPWVSKADYPYLIEQDPYASRDALPQATTLRAQQYGAGRTGRNVGVRGPRPRRRLRRRRRGGGAGAGPRRRHGPAQCREGQLAWRDPALACPAQHRRDARPQRQESAHWITRTALCVEVRDPMRANGPKAEAEHGGKSGVLYVFMPPLARLEDYLDLLAAVEATAEELGMKIVLEGYPPPRDPRLKLLQVTPDPGVIEVNIHPAHNWGELVEHTEFLYEAAHQTRLSAEKFMTDGRHTGTGGGNHFVLGGATPTDSPFLRRPSCWPAWWPTGTTTHP
jgi:uncharacterized protein (DUF2126 family)